ncbi:hypothetical protein KO02_12415 [Sphingobacterium sp. ML3W]|uniref:Cas9 inhibitor AcrIIA9 family protein n=1 Tax=Sphingobacterium sp. ML3W TaxID=1538644 RepID=UPI0004F8B037|nr:Cas9 inhibitor AcrIIA9 family protein [Sphingobacterium sp. ML3W]AIM37405.1 hypothetical protein KO02_12415 [Sphingobacterium sp. ML3W]
MKASNDFQTTIQEHLNELASKDPLFAETLKKKNKNINECCHYILSEVQKAKRNAWTDPEIFNMAVHYYDEDDIKNVKSINNYSAIHTTEKVSEVEGKVKKEEPKQSVKRVLPKQIIENQISLF